MSVKVALVNLGDGRNYSQIDEGLGLASAGLEWIASFLEYNNVPTKIIDQSMYDLTEEDVIKKILKSGAEIVGFNPLSNSRSSFHKIVEKIKERRPEITVIIGGYDATFRPLTAYKDVDFLVRGRGEKAMLEIARSVVEGRDCLDIPGVVYKKGNSQVVENLGQRAESLSLEQLPLPKRQNIKYLIKFDETVSIVSSIGCDYHCKFCSTPAMYPEHRQERPLNLILQEIDYLSKSGVKRLSFWDEDFFGYSKASMERANTTVQHVKKLGGIITFSFITAPGIIWAERLGYLKLWEGTVNRVYLGVEGGCNTALDRLGKESCRSARVNKNVIQTIRKYNIGLQIGFIMFNPYSDFQELEESANFLYRNNEAVNMISLCHHLRPYPGTEMYNQLRNDGLLIEEESDAEIDRYVDLPYHFKCDLNTGRNMKDFAVAMGEISADDRVGESDRLNNEIYMRLVELDFAKKIFSNEETVEVVQKYRILRREISDLNFNFFMYFLKIFRNNDEIRFGGELKEKYLSQLGEFLPKLRQIKREVSN